MKKHRRELASAHESEPIPSVRGEGRGGSGHRRSGWSREELLIEPDPTRMQRRSLAISTALLLLACGGLALWGLNQHSTRVAAMGRLQAQNKRLADQLFAATTALEESRLSLDTLVNSRIPGLLPFRVGEPISVDTPFVLEISFKPATPPASGHECKLVIENDSSSVIRPNISVAVFDDVGIEVARAQLVDASHDSLRPDEVRSFFANLESADGIVPGHFRITSD
jgi:hypothetical protein